MNCRGARLLFFGTARFYDIASSIYGDEINSHDFLPDPVRFFEQISGFIEAAAKEAQSEQPQVVLFGEAVNLLQAEGKADAAIRLEQLWTEVGRTFALDIFCGYDSSNFHGDEHTLAFHSSCAEHSAVYSQ